MRKLLFLIFVALIVAGGIYWFIGQRSLDDISAIPFRDGKYLGYIHNVDTGALMLSFDDAVWLTGTVAQDAAIEAGHCTEVNRSECTPNNYFIKNTEVRNKTLPLDQDVILFMQTWRMEETGVVTEREIGLADFTDLINNPSLHWRILPYNITIQDGKVTRIEEVYIP